MLDRDDKCRQSFSRNRKERDLFEDQNVDVKVLLNWILKKQDRRLGTGFIWLKIGTNCGL
jgi:hypothetical protein